MIRSTAICAVALMTAMGLFAPAFADEPAETAAADIAIAVASTNPDTTTDQSASQASDEALPDTLHAFDDVPGAAASVEHVDILVENKTLSVRSRRTGTDGVLIEAGPIFTHLKGQVSVGGTVLSYRRFHDNAELSIDMTNGTVRDKERVLGALPDFRSRKRADMWLSPNAISFLTGTIASQDEFGTWTFTLSEQLRPKFDLDLWIEGEQITNPDVEPRSIGPVLLVPLKMVAETLGHTIERQGENVVTVRRIQDSATLSLDLSTGLVTVNNTPRGVTPNIAFADPVTLLLPFTAVETLTGTHIELIPGTNRIDVRLDERLGGGVLPGERIDDETAATGFTPESLEFSLSDRGPVNLTFASRYKGYNTQLQYDTVGGLDDFAELAPATVSLNVQSLDGWVGSIGDSSTRFRELSPVNQSRIRGVTWRRRNEADGNLIALAAGVTPNGSTAVSEDASRTRYGGFAAGGRIVAANGRQEGGVALSVSPGGETVRVIAGAQAQLIERSADEELGLKGLFVAADAGVVATPLGTDLDFRGRAQARYKLHQQVNLQANVDYTAAQPNQSGNLASTPTFEGALDDRTGGRFVGSASVDWRSVRNWGPLSSVAAGVRTRHTRMGGPIGTSASTNISGSVNGQIPAARLSVSADAGITIANPAGGERITSHRFGARVLKRFDLGSIQATYSNAQTPESTIERLAGSITLLPVRKTIGNKGANIVAAPTLSFAWSPEQASARFGASVSADSGRTFGDRLNLQARFSALQSLDPEQSGTRFLGSLSSTLKLSRNIELRSSYFDTFDGNRDFSLALRGRINFNAPRRHTRPVDGLGVLKGQVYFDRNRDGIRQPDEPGVGGVRVQVAATRLGLNVDPDGYFTIQNMREGLYGLVVDRRSLPLGLLVPDDAAARATVGADRVTHIDIPIIASGQVRGAIFVDDNASGEADPGETRVEGMFITIRKTGSGDDADDRDTEARDGETEIADENEEITQISASFGQYSFENLSPGVYELSVNYKGIVYTRMVTLTEKELFVVEPFALPGADQEGGEVDTSFEASVEAVA